MLEKVVSFLLRVSLGVIFFVFGTGKLQNDYWARTIKAMDFFQHLPWSPTLSALLIGILEIITGVLLIIGLFSRLASAIAALQLLGILILLNFQEIRDIGLLAAALYMVVVKDGSLGIDWLFSRFRKDIT